MPLSKVRGNIANRLNLININLRHLQSSEPQELTFETSEIHKIQKGLYYVHLYSALEKSVNEIIERVLLVIDSMNVKHEHFIVDFNVISLDAQMKSYKMAGKDRSLECMINVFGKMHCQEVSKINNTIFSYQLQNIWFETIQTLFICFGITQIEDINGDIKVTIDEVVEKRNAVAHGRIPADKVGERQRCDVLQKRTTVIQSTLNLVTNKFEKYLNNKNYIKEEFKIFY